MTYTILAHCARTGRFGLATASYSIIIGMQCDGAVRQNVGATFTQAAPNWRNNRLALNLLAQGYSTQRALAEVIANDAGAEFRQIGILDREGAAAVHTGPKIGQWAGHEVGPYYAAYGNGLAGPQTVQGIVAGFMKNPEMPLEHRLLEALEGGHAAGGQATKGRYRPERSAWLRVVGQLDHPEIDLRVDLHDDTLGQLRRLFEAFKRYEPYYRGLADDPQAAMPEEEFVAGLAAG